MLSRVIVVTGLVFGLSGLAQAATLATGQILIDEDPANGNRLFCQVVNIGKKDVEVTITAVLDTVEESGPLVLGPGGRAGQGNSNNFISGVDGYCVFEVKGNKRNVRGSACALDANSSCRAALPAL